MSSRRHITKQHVVSRVLLAEFAVDGYLEMEDVRHRGRWRLRSPTAVAYVKDFVQHDSADIEALWQAVETRLPEALRLVRSGRAPRPGSVEERVLRDCLALHWARSNAVKTASNAAWHRVQALHMETFRREGHMILQHVHEQRTGRLGTDAELDALNVELHAGPPEVLDGRHFAQRIQTFYDFARDWVGQHHVQVLSCGEGVEDLVISDSPVLTPNSAWTGWNPAQGVALGDAGSIGMPVGPRTYVNLVASPQINQLGAAQVALLNHLQESVRQQQLFRRPKGLGQVQRTRT